MRHGSGVQRSKAWNPSSPISYPWVHAHYEGGEPKAREDASAHAREMWRSWPKLWREAVAERALQRLESAGERQVLQSVSASSIAKNVRFAGLDEWRSEHLRPR